MKSPSASRYLALLAGLAVGLGAAVGGMNWRVDPLNFYRMPARVPYFSEQARYRNPGLALHADYDAVILGTSVSLGFDRKHVDGRLGTRVLNLAMQGASAHEQALLLEVALRSGHLRRVIWDLNYEFFRGTPGWVSDYDGPFPMNFYDENPWNEVPHYLLNWDVAKLSARVLLNRSRSADLDVLTQLHPPRAPGLASVRAACDHARAGTFVFKMQPGEFAPALTATSFDTNCLAVMRAHPGVQFDLYFPAFSIAYHALVREVAAPAFDAMLGWKEDIARKVSALPNVRLHDFQGRPEIVCDFDRYTDTVHCDGPTHDLLIDAFASGEDLVSPGQLERTAEFLRATATPDWAVRR
jgi:hypothetical protein